MSSTQAHLRIAMKTNPRRNLWKYTLLLAILAIALGMKAWLVFTERVPFNSDEAVVGLMARHILAGEKPTFFYGQAYMGSLDAYLIAAGFAVFGPQVWVIRLVQALLYAGTILTTYLLGVKGLKSELAGIAAAAVLAIPSVNVTLYTTASLGGYGEALLIGNLILLVGLRLSRLLDQARVNPDVSADLPGKFWAWTAVFAALTGFGLWVFGLTLVFSVPVWIYLFWQWMRFPALQRRWPRLLGSGFAGLVIGATPWWGYALRFGFHDLVAELSGSAVAVEQAGFITRFGMHLFNYLVLGITVVFGFRPPWEVSWLALPILPLVLVIWGVTLVFAVRRLKTPGNHQALYLLAFGVLIIQAGAYLLTSFGVDPSGRYFLPLAVPLALFFGDFLVTPGRIPASWKGAMLVILLAGNLWGTLQVAGQVPPGLTTQFDASTRIDPTYNAELSAFLREKGETRGYTTYWVSYPLAFNSQEDLIYIPRLPYHADFRYTPRDDRYTPYEDQVRASQRVAYITVSFPELDQRIRAAFEKLDIDYQEENIGPYRVFYGLSEALPPEALDLYAGGA